MQKIQPALSMCVHSAPPDPLESTFCGMVPNVFACSHPMMMRGREKGIVRGRMRERIEEEVMKEEPRGKKI